MQRFLHTPLPLLQPLVSLSLAKMLPIGLPICHATVIADIFVTITFMLIIQYCDTVESLKDSFVIHHITVYVFVLSVLCSLWSLRCCRVSRWGLCIVTHFKRMVVVWPKVLHPLLPSFGSGVVEAAYWLACGWSMEEMGLLHLRPYQSIAFTSVFLCSPLSLY